MSLFNKKNKVKPKWGALGWRRSETVKRECFSCYQWYETLDTTRNHCDECFEQKIPWKDRPKDDNDELPF